MSIVRSIFNFLRFNKKNWKAVFLCIFAATVFWFFNALNKSYTANIAFPLEFDYHEEGYIPIRPLPNEVRINVTGIGWNLFRRSVGVKVPPLVIPLEHPSEIRKIVGSTLPALFANQLEGFEINFVLTDTLYIAVEPRASRWVSLKLDSPTILFRDGYGMATEATLVPDSIFINGPLKLISDLTEPHYLKLDQRNIDSDFLDDVEIRFLNNELITRDPPTVSVSFGVDRLQVVTDSINLKLIHVPDGLRTEGVPAVVLCTFSIPTRMISRYHRDSVIAVIDLKNNTHGEAKFLPEVVGVPPFTHIIKNDSVRVNY